MTINNLKFEIALANSGLTMAPSSRKGRIEPAAFFYNFKSEECDASSNWQNCQGCRRKSGRNHRNRIKYAGQRVK